MLKQRAHGCERTAVMHAWAVALQGSQVRARAVAGMPVKAIFRILRVQFEQHSVARNLGENRGRRNGGICASPRTMAWARIFNGGHRLPSICASVGLIASVSTARRIASKVAFRMFKRSISSTDALAMQYARARAQISSKSAARF